MSEENKKTVIDTKIGNILKSNSNDKVVLVGEYLEPGGEYVENLQIIITPEGDNPVQIIKGIPYGGYFLKLFIGDFNGDGKSEIMVRGGYGGLGGFEIGSIYKLRDTELVEIFNPDIFSSKYRFEGKYLENKKIEINSIDTKQKFIIDISNRSPKYLDTIYNANGSINSNSSITVSAINAAYPINKGFNKNYSLIVYQRIIGTFNANTVGIIESYVELLNNNINANFMGLLLVEEGQEFRIGEYNTTKNIYMRDFNKVISGIYQLPIGAIKIPLDNACNKEGVIHCDIDCDGNEEGVIGYNLGGIPFISVFKNNKLIADYKGQGIGISDIKIKKVGKHPYLFVSWLMEEKQNKLEILSYKKGKLKSEYKIEMPYCYKFYIEDLGDGRFKELTLWSYDTDDKYIVTVYKLNHKSIVKIAKYDYKK